MKNIRCNGPYLSWILLCWITKGKNVFLTESSIIIKVQLSIGSYQLISGCLSERVDLTEESKGSVKDIELVYNKQERERVLTSNIVQSVLRKSSYSFFTCSIESFLSAAFGARPSTTLAASSSVIPANTSIGTYTKTMK